MTQLVNLTPHPITLIAKAGATVTIAPSGQVARATAVQHTVATVTVDGIPFSVDQTVFGDVTGLPAPMADTMYIVSMVVMQALGGTRPDVIGPNTSPAGAKRDADGKIVGVLGFQRV